MSTLTNAQRHIEKLTEDLHGEDDFMPFLICRTGDKEFYVGLAAMADETKEDIADVMFAAVAVTRAEEAVFASSSWVVKKPQDEKVTARPSEHPDRQEAAVVTQCTRDGDAMYMASIYRRENKVLLGAWDKSDIPKHGGRFADAIRAGMRMGAGMPEEMQEFCQQAIDAGEIEAVLRPAMRAFRRVRTGETTSGVDITPIKVEEES